MQNYLVTQVFSVITALFLIFIFFVLLAASIVSGFQSFATPILLVIISMIGIVILLHLSKIEYTLSKKK